MERKLKTKLVNIGFAIFIVFGAVKYCSVSDKVGFNIPFNKAGRQIFIQSLDSYFKNLNIKVESDFYDHNILIRIISNVDMRTTIRLIINGENNKISEKDTNDFFLNLPVSNFLKGFQYLHLDDNSTIKTEKLLEILNKNNVLSVKGLLEEMGFEKFEIYENNKMKIQILLNPKIYKKI